MKSPVEQLLEKLESNQRMFQNANLHIANGALEPTIKFAKELLVTEKMMMSEQYQKGHAAGVISGKIEAQTTRI
jgi:hypothetical protein